MKEGATKLSQAEKRALRKFVRRSNGQLQAETVCDGLPMISENTCLRLCSDYHINPQKTMQELAMEVPPGEAFHQGMEVAQGYLKFFSKSDSHLTDHINRWAENNLRGFTLPMPPFAIKECVSIGMCVVISAFNVECKDGQFIDRLASVHPKKVMDAFDQIKGDFMTRIGVLDRVINDNRIPLYQQNLVSLVEQIAPVPSFEKIFICDGASAMYHVIDNLWPQLS